MFRSALATVLACCFAVPAGAVATPATPDFLTAWEKSDRLLAQSDVAGSFAAIEPLMARIGELDQNSAERVWFAYSVERILFIVGREEEYKTFAKDEAPISIQERDALKTPADATCPVGSTRGTIPLFGADDWIPNGRTPAFRGGWFRATGDHALTQSYFGPVSQQPKTVETPSPVTWCNYLPLRADGSPIGRYPSQNNPFAAAIPADSDLMTTRRLQPRQAFTVQAYAPPGTRTQAVWTPRGGGKAIRAVLKLVGNSTTITAPKSKGRYSLSVQMRLKKYKYWGLATEVYGIGVGTAPAPYRDPSKVKPVSPLDGGR